MLRFNSRLLGLHVRLDFYIIGLNQLFIHLLSSVQVKLIYLPV